LIEEMVRKPPSKKLTKKMNSSIGFIALLL
jgi:hypothetical protein